MGPRESNFRTVAGFRRLTWRGHETVTWKVYETVTWKSKRRCVHWLRPGARLDIRKTKIWLNTSG
ncbi:hypothetical protein E2C01_084873 [Portunus trituberculatus]|uniref:Uncharacterized protein n=1 Tax=Portunus trituberculatus TaxID=210409 RepID=A0A5B7IZF6_PORTR|nr:hypothetical protein [Portunus trituberculatus]